MQSKEDTLAKEHVLCPVCKESVDASRLLRNPTRGLEPFRSYTDIGTLETSASNVGCHLCSLFLRKIRALPVAVTLEVSRSGGITFTIKVGEQSAGDLAIAPVDEAEENNPSVPVDANFTLPKKILEDAQLARSVASEASFRLARQWLQQCLRQHIGCSKAAVSARTSTVPSRLVDIGDGAKSPLRVVVTQRFGMDGLKDLKYLTLSHCWGGAHILRLLIDNMDQLTVKIPMDSLPTTFQHAVVITRQLGYRYIWIDSLCIIQNSTDDWKACAAVMGEIYANSDCTVAALTARNSYEGCFFDEVRNPLSFRPCRISDRWYVEGNLNVGVDLRKGLSALPLHTRAWVAQERILAPRTLYYGSNGLAWECTECSATEAIPWGQVSKFSPKASFDILRQRSHDDLYDYWIDVQIAYTRCDLTKFSDRLVAISGVIKRIEKETGWTNVWGLWSRREQMLRELLWFVEEPTGRPDTEGYVAPTWSWVGIKGRVMMTIGRTEKTEWMAEVVRLGTFEGRGYVQIKGMTREVRLTDEGRLAPRLVGATNEWEEVDWDPDDKAHVGKELQCLLIARRPEYIGDNGFDSGLVISRVWEDIWSRVGRFQQLRGDSSLFPESREDLTKVIIL